MTVHDWLHSGRDYEQGRLLYAALGDNDRLKRLFAQGANNYNREAVLWELQKLARGGVVTAAVTINVTTAPVAVPIAVPVAVARELPAVVPPQFQGLDEYGNRVAPIKYFLPLATKELLDELEEAQRPLYDERRVLHAQLELLATDADRFDASQRIMELTRQIDAGWNTIHYVQAHGQLPPPPAPPVDLATLTPAELLQKRNNLRSQVSRLKSKPNRAADLAQAKTDLAAVEALLSHE